MSRWGVVYVTSQGDSSFKTSTGKLFILPSGLIIKKQGEWLQRSVLGPPPALARPRDEVSIG